MGEQTLKRHQEAMTKFGLDIEELTSRPHTFRYGNGTSDTSTRRVQIPVYLGGAQLRMRVHVVPGEVPLLVSKRFLKSLGANLDLGDNHVHFKKLGISTEMLEKRDGSYQINLLDFKGPAKLETDEVDVIPKGAETKVNMVTDRRCPETEGNDGGGDQSEDDYDEAGAWCVFKTLERKQLQEQLSEVLPVLADDSTKPTMIEIFSPGRFQEACEKFGVTCRGSFDLSDGWDWRKIRCRARAEEAIELMDPDVLLICPPCGPLSKLQNLTPASKRLDPEAFAREQRIAGMMVDWSVRMALKQLSRGKDYIFESSQGCHAWKRESVERLRRASWHQQVDVPACAVGLKDKSSGHLFGKKWRFMTSKPSVAAVLERLKCSGDHVHQAVEGSSGGQLRSVQSQVYPPKLINIILGGIAMSDVFEDACMAVSQATIQNPEIKGDHRRQVERAIRKMHINLGHASTEDMIRILRHHHAQPQVLEMVRAFQCDLCSARQMPKAVRDSAPPRDLAPLRYIGLDVKWLPTWKKDYKIKAVNIVCRASGLQQIFPFRETETSEVIARLYRQWTRAFGRPRYIKFDASRCNLGQPFLDLLERDGTTPLDIPGEAHHQMGDVESQGGHFEVALIKVIDEMNPSDYNEWLECVDVTVEARNSIMRRGGYSPNQLVFGRDPEYPGDDILAEAPNPIANSAILEDAIAQFSHAARHSARKAVLESLDHRAARIALNSRPRPHREFRPGDEVAIWRRGRGIKKSTARWRGPGLVAGSAGGNYWISMPGAFVKCAPEQIRLRTTEEREADRFLVRDLRAASAALFPEVGVSNRTQKNFVDITKEDLPPGDLLSMGSEAIPDCRADSRPPLSSIAEESQPVEQQHGDQHESSRSESRESSGYSMGSLGSLGDRISQMSGEDLQQWMESAARANQLDSHSLRRPASTAAGSADPKRARTEFQQVSGMQYPPSMPSPPQSVGRAVSEGDLPSSNEILSSSSDRSVIPVSSTCSFVQDSAAQATCFSSNEDTTDVNFVLACDETDALIVGGRKEINMKDEKWRSEDRKQRIMQGWMKEFNTVVHDKKALRPIPLEESRVLRQQYPDRIMPSRLVLTEKDQEDGTFVVKARWTARGDRDPDLYSLVRDGRTQAPTISANGRFLVLQIIASLRFVLQLGDVTGAFLESDALSREHGPLFMDAPRHDLPGYEPGQLFEVIRPMYGLNDSPQLWFRKFRNTTTGLKWKQSRMDPCVFLLWDGDTLVGIMGVHVDDVLVGGRGELFEESLKLLKKQFPFRKWKLHAGSFCGAELSQCKETFNITVSQESFAEKLQRPKLRMKDSPLLEVTEEETSSLKSTLGGALWLAKETRPDLAVQVSQGQQMLPKPTLGEARTIGNVVRRAKQYKHLTWKILAIPLSELRLVLHTDAAFANAKKQGTQAGYLVGVTNDNLRSGKPAPWAPITWKSYRLKRVVGSTFAGESQVLMGGLGHAEWIACHLAEAKYRDFSLAEREKYMESFGLQAIVDCKSIYDHLQSYASPGSVGDKRVAIDLVIVRETLQRLHGSIRWAPTWIQLADALTKENPEAMDILRAALITNQYHLHAESTNMQAAAEQRQLRVSRKLKVSTTPDSAQATQVCFVSGNRRNFDMVKVSAVGFTEEEIRALFEVMASVHAKNGEDYLQHLQQSKAMVKIKISAHAMNSKLFRGEENLITLTYTKSTKMIAITGGATYLDGVEDTLTKVLKTYKDLIQEKIVSPMPDGCEGWGQALKNLMDEGIMSYFLRDQEKPEMVEKGDKDRQVFVPTDEPFVAAVADLMNEGSRKLHEYPLWRNKFLSFMVKEFNGSHDQAMILAGMSADLEEAMMNEEEWGVVRDAQPKAKAKSYPGYRQTQ